MKLAITTTLAILGMAGGAYTYDVSVRASEHEFIQSSAKADAIDLDLRLIELELKQLRAIEERRQLTPDEMDRVEYLKARREVLLASRK